MKGSLLVLILAFYVSCVFSDDCDFNVTPSTDLAGMISAQNWVAPTSKILCFAAGTYSYSVAPDYQLDAPQQWRGARANDDPTCNGKVKSCARLQSAKIFDDTAESVIVLNGATNIFLHSSSNFFNFSGFAVHFSTTSSDFIDANVLYMYNNYILTQGPIVGTQIFAFNNYLDGTSSGSSLLQPSSTGSMENNYFTNSGGGLSGSIVTIQGNSFVDLNAAFSSTEAALIRNNLFLFNNIVGSSATGSFWEANSFILNNQGIAITSSAFTLSTTGNCFLDNNQPLVFGFLDGISVDNSFNNYLGPSELASAGFYDTGSGQLGSPEQTPPVFSSPLVCPKTFFSAFVLHPKNVIIGQSMDIFWSFKLGTSLIESGLDLTPFNQTTVTFYIYDGQYDSSASFKTLSLTDTVYLNKFGVATNSLSYTPQFSDFATSPMHGMANNYTLVANIAFTTSLYSNPFSHTFVAAEALIVQFDIPEVCRDRSNVVEIPKTARFNGPVTLNLTQLFCDTVQWNISSINQQPLHAPAVSVNGDNSVSFTIDPNSSGQFNFVLNITSLSQPSLVHRLLAKVNIINTNPYVTPYRYFNFTQLSEVNGVNLLFNSSDADSDTVTIKSIFPRGDKNFTKIDALSVYFHFNGTGFVVVSDASGNLSVHDVDLTNPQVPATAGAFSGKFKFSFGINFVATDGDRSNQYAEGSVIFHHIPSSSS